MKIREADLKKDALAITEGAKSFAEKMSLGKFISDNFLNALSGMVVYGGVKIYIAEHNGVPVGGLGVNFAPFMWNHDLLIADEKFWWTNDDAPFRTAILLFKHAMKEIDERGAEPMFRALENSPSGVDKMYRKEGMVPMETVYARAE